LGTLPSLDLFVNQSLWLSPFFSSFLVSVSVSFSVSCCQYVWRRNSLQFKKKKIILEFCSARSVSDVLRLTKRTLSENQIASICRFSLLTNMLLMDDCSLQFFFLFFSFLFHLFITLFWDLILLEMLSLGLNLCTPI